MMDGFCKLKSAYRVWDLHRGWAHSTGSHRMSNSYWSEAVRPKNQKPKIPNPKPKAQNLTP